MILRPTKPHSPTAKLTKSKFLKRQQCAQSNGLAWWQEAVIYEVAPISFLDTDGDGKGDLRGIIERLDYFTWLGIDAVWLTPFYRSPMLDLGYDISDFCSVDPVYGTLDDFDQLI